MEHTEIDWDTPIPIDERTEVVMRGVLSRNNRNGVRVVDVSYVADPEKDPATPNGRKWVQDFKRTSGYTSSMWRKEMERDFGALGGKQVYEEWDREFHLVEPYEIPRSWQRIMSADPGLANPFAAVWAAIKPNGWDIVIYDTFKKAGLSVSEQASIVRGKEGLDVELIKWRVMDATAWNRNPIDLKSQAGKWESEGYVYRKGTKDELSRIDTFHVYLHHIKELGKTDRNPRLTVFKDQHEFITEIEHWKYRELSAAAAAVKDPGEKPQDKNNHLMDAAGNMLHELPRTPQNNKGSISVPIGRRKRA